PVYNAPPRFDRWRGPLSERPRILLLTGPDGRGGTMPAPLAEQCDVVAVHSPAEGLAALRGTPLDGFFASTGDPAILERVRALPRKTTILTGIDGGGAMVGTARRVLWANATFEKWCGGPAVGRPFAESLGGPAFIGPNTSPFDAAKEGKSSQARLRLA